MPGPDSCPVCGEVYVAGFKQSHRCSTVCRKDGSREVPEGWCVLLFEPYGTGPECVLPGPSWLYPVDEAYYNIVWLSPWGDVYPDYQDLVPTKWDVIGALLEARSEG